MEELTAPKELKNSRLRNVRFLGVNTAWLKVQDVGGFPMICDMPGDQCCKTQVSSFEVTQHML